MLDRSNTGKRLVNESGALRQRALNHEKPGTESTNTPFDIPNIRKWLNFIPLAKNDAIFVWDLLKDQLWCHEVMQKRLGVKEMIDHPKNWWVGVMHPDDRKRMVSSLERWLKSDSKFRASEYRIQCPDNTYIYISIRGYVVRGHEGRPVFLIGAATDVTESKLAIQELKESQQKLSDIVNFLPDATFVVDDAGKVIAWNRAIEEMTGVRATDMLGKGNREYALPFYGKRRPLLIDHVLKPQEEIEAKYAITRRGDKVFEGETYIPQLRGCEAYLYGKVSILQNSRGKIVGAIQSIRDITALRQAEGKYRSIFENAVMGIFQSTPEGRFINANPTLARILGYETPDELMKTVTDITRQLFVHPNKRFEFLRSINENDTVQEKEVQWFRKNKTVAWLALNGRAVRDNEGNVTYYEAAIQDITERKTLELQLRQAQKMEAIGTLAGGIAHDFNNILSAVIGYAEMAKRESDISALRRYLDQIYKAGIRARDLVKQILTFSRQSDTKLYSLSISPIVKEVMKLLRASLPTTIEIQQQIQTDPDCVLADPTHIHQILMNLCTNAAQAMAAGKGTLRVELKPVEVKPDSILTRHGLLPGMHARLTVSDTGHGIAPENLNKIFDPFFTTKRPGEGTGMGLSVVHGIVKSYGGTIAVQSETGKGAKFDVYLPLLTETGRERQKRSCEAYRRWQRAHSFRR